MAAGTKGSTISVFKTVRRVRVQCFQFLPHDSLRTPYLSLLILRTLFFANHWHSCFPGLVQYFHADCKRRNFKCFLSEKYKTGAQESRHTAQD